MSNFSLFFLNFLGPGRTDLIRPETVKTLEAQQRCLMAEDLQEGVLDLGSQELVTHVCPFLERDRSLTVVPARNMSWRGPRARTKALAAR